MILSKSVCYNFVSMTKRNYTNAFILYFDLLGFKNFTENHTPDDVMSILLIIQNEIRSWSDSLSTLENSLLDFHFESFSDSIFIAIIPPPNNDQYILPTFGGANSIIRSIQKSLIQSKTPTLIRGGFAFGDYYNSPGIHENKSNVMFGNAINRAVTCEKKLEEKHAPPCIAIDKSVFDKLFSIVTPESNILNHKLSNILGKIRPLDSASDQLVYDYSFDPEVMSIISTQIQEKADDAKKKWHQFQEFLTYKPTVVEKLEPLKLLGWSTIIEEYLKLHKEGELLISSLTSECFLSPEISGV